MTPKELKNSILQLAIEGKLVEQRKEEGSAEILYAEIQKEKQKLIKQGKIKKEKELPEITEDEIPFEIPKSWKWVRLNDLGIYKKGPFGSSLTKSMFVRKSKDTIKVYEQKNAINKNNNLGEYYIKKSYFEQKMMGFEVFPNDIIVSCAGTIGETYIMPKNMEKGIINQALMKITLYSNKYVKFYLLYFDTILKKSASTSSKGSAIKNIPPFEILKKYVFPLPPFEEQKRIVEKIEELMPLVDKYEVLYNRLNELNKEFPKKLKNAVLQKAIEGKLVPQIKSEGSAEILYAEIQKEKQKLIKQGKIKKEKELPEITEDEIPFEIPKSWKWVRLGEIGSWGSGATPSKSEDKYFKNGNIPWLLTGDLNDGYINSSPQYITKLALEKTSVKLNPKGSVLIAMYGATIGKLGILNIEATTNQACCACQTFKGVYNKYLFYFLMAYKKRFTEKAEGGAQPNISKEKIVNTHFSLPPFEEQKRIVEKIEEILPNIKKLEKYD